MRYMLIARDYCDRKQQHVNSALYSVVYVWCSFGKAATVICSSRVLTWQMEQISMYFSACSSVAGWHWQSIDYTLLPP